MQSWKDVSEIARNWITAIGIVVGGAWAFFEWNTLLPKTNAEIAREISAIRARTDGELTITLAAPPEGEYAYTADNKDYSTVCETARSVALTVPMRATLRFASTSDLAVRVVAERLSVAAIAGEGLVLRPDAQVPAFEPQGVEQLADIPLTAGAFVDGLDWTHVEPGGSASIVVFGMVNLPFDCRGSSHPLSVREFYFSLRTRIEPVLDREVRPDETATRFFGRSCLVQPAGNSSCEPGADAAGGIEIAAQ